MYSIQFNGSQGDPILLKTDVHPVVLNFLQEKFPEEYNKVETPEEYTAFVKRWIPNFECYKLL